MFKPETDIITQGSNTLLLQHPFEITEQLLVVLSVNGNKRPLTYEQVDRHTIAVVVDATQHATYTLLIRNNHEVSTVALRYQVSHKPKSIAFSSYLSYKNGMIYLHVLSDKLIQHPMTVIVSGELQANVVWVVGQRMLTIPFVRLVESVSYLRYTINGQVCAGYALNKDYFPTQFIKTSTGLKLNSSCDLPLTVRVDDVEIPIQAHQRDVSFTWSSYMKFRVYHEQILLFEQDIQGERMIPKLVVAKNPIRLKIGFPTLENVEVTIKGMDTKLFIEAGNTELEFKPPLAEEIEILSVINARLEQSIWRF
jgi:hypothetical protein